MQDAEDAAGRTPLAGAVVPSARPVAQSAADASASLDGVLQDLESLDDLDVGEHVAVFGRMHTALTDALARTADSGPEPER
jgi:CII-binding regulator of phage lambda lysogenization HflD